MPQRIVVINPNSTVAVTRGMDAALAPLRLAGGPAIESLTLPEGPPGIESEEHVAAVVAPLCRLIEREEPETDAFVIACFPDPGLHAARERTGKPVFGIMEGGLTAALNLGAGIGVVAILDRSIPRHRRAYRAMGIDARIAGERALGIPVVELADERRTFARMLEVGAALRDEHGADVLVLGCAGMAQYRERLQDELGTPVIDPTQAAVGMALAAVRIGLRRGAR
jgi:Asp/Glu/hydantoin racemase